MKKQSAFTLIEVLVVVAIIGLLVGIMMPSLAAARRQTRLVNCAARLSQVGKAVMSYLPSNRDRMPHVSLMPSISPAPLDIAKPAVYFAEVLRPQLKGNLQVLQCPDDKPGFTERSAPNTSKSFYQSERASYEFRVRLAGKSPSEFGDVISHHRHGDDAQRNTNIPSNTIWISRDYDNFHATRFITNPVDDTVRPKAGAGARRYLYIDGHVTDFELY